jgi:hypothetical protein
MDLETFVAETLRRIVKGVAIAQQHEDCKGAQINPIDRRPGHPDGETIKQIDFDIALTATEEKEQQGQPKRNNILVAAVFGSGGAETPMASNSSVSRVKFSVPIVLPTK